jgi:hypothetical protein
MSTTPKHPPKTPQTPAPTPEDPLDEALDETFPASDPIAIHPDKDVGEDQDKKTKH